MQKGLSVRDIFLKGERITITSGKHQFLAFILFLFGSLALVALVTISFLASIIGLFISILLIVILLFLAIIAVYHSFLISDLAIKKDTVYISHFFTTSRIIGIEDVQKIHQFKMINLNFLYIDYTCGEKQRRSLIIKNSSHSNLEKLHLLLDEFHNTREIES